MFIAAQLFFFGLRTSVFLMKQEGEINLLILLKKDG